MMPNAAIVWIWLCAFLNSAGWVLSSIHQLNPTGYAVVLAIGLGALLWLKKKASVSLLPKLRPQKLRRRFRRVFPLSFLILAALAFIGGALYLPANYDALAYRTPRVLHWLAEGQWHWIHSDFPRLNTRSAGFEWLTAPQFLFFHTDRLVFLLNIVAFLLLPGRVFAILTQLGVRPRAAWHWMWIFPTGYGYLLQAGSVGNDMFGSLMALAAIEFALRAGREKNDFHLWTSGLAAGLMTAVKAFNLMLLLPWAIAALPAWKLLLRRPVASVIVILFAASASMAPTAILNWKQCGDWSGLKIEQPTIGGGAAGIRFLANALNLPAANLVPPIFPLNQEWDQLMKSIIPRALTEKMRGNLEGGQASIRLPELQVEESAGLGCGVTLLLLVLLMKKIRSGDIRPRKFLSLETLVPLGAWAAVGVFMMQSGASGPARYLLPFYLLLAAPILAGTTAGGFFRNKFWRGAALVVVVMAGVTLVLTPARPLWPVKTVLRLMNAEQSNNRLLQRAWAVYSTYGSRADGFAPALAELPAGTVTLGFFGWDEPETGLWRPFEARRVLHIRFEDSAADLRARGINYALVSERTLAQHHQMTPDEWLQRMNAKQIGHFEIKLLAGQPPQGWLLAQLP